MNEDRWFFVAIVTFVSLLLACIVVPPILGLTGAIPEYSVGERSGYVNKLSVKGLIWKTNEGELQVGSGQQASLQTPFEFSVTDPEVVRQVIEAQRTGSRVTLRYRQWLVMPWRVGESGYEILSIKGAEK